MKTKKSQTIKILTHLLKGKKLSSLEALKKFGCFRLASRIFEIEDMGLIVDREYISSDKKKYMKYYIPKTMLKNYRCEI